MSIVKDRDCKSPRVCSQLLTRVAEQVEVDEAEEDLVELVVASGDPAEALEPEEEALDLVAAPVAVSVVGPAWVAEAGRRDDGSIAQFARQLTGLVDVIGAFHAQRRGTGDRPEPAQQVTTNGRIATLSGCEPDEQRGAFVGDQGVEIAAQTAARSVDRAAPLF